MFDLLPELIPPRATSALLAARAEHAHQPGNGHPHPLCAALFLVARFTGMDERGWLYDKNACCRSARQLITGSGGLVVRPVWKRKSVHAMTASMTCQ